MCKELIREQSYDKVQLENYVAANEPLFTPDQQAAYDPSLELLSKRTVESCSSMHRVELARHFC